jgi:hypothetical protein
MASYFQTIFFLAIVALVMASFTQVLGVHSACRLAHRIAALIAVRQRSLDSRRIVPALAIAQSWRASLRTSPCFQMCGVCIEQKPRLHRFQGHSSA